MNKIILSTITTNKNYLQLGLYNIKAYVLKYNGSNKFFNIDIDIINPQKNILKQGEVFPDILEKEINTIVNSMLKQKPKIIGFSCFMWNIELILKISKRIKKINKNITIVLGGPEVSYHAEKILVKNPQLDIICRHEGEKTFSEIIDSVIFNKRSLMSIKGITYFEKNKIKSNIDSSLLNLGEIPSPFLNNLIKIKKKMKICIETARGCPFKCAYCTFHIMGGNRVRFFPLAKIKKELAFILDKNPSYLWINDDNFNLNSEHAYKILKIIHKHKKQTQISVFLHASLWPLPKKIAFMLTKTKIKVLIGVQSVNQQTLELVNRKTNFLVLKKNLKLLYEYKIPFSLQFILGLPNDNYTDLEKSVNWAIDKVPEEVTIFPLMILPGSRMNFLASKYKIKYNLYPPYIVYETKEMKKKDIIRGLDLSKAVNFLYNKKFLKNVLFYLKQKYNINYLTIFNQWNIFFAKEENRNQNLTKIQKRFILFLSKLYFDKKLEQKVPVLGNKDLILYIKYASHDIN